MTLRFYFSDNNKKNSYRSMKHIDEKIVNYSQNLLLLKKDTSGIVEYIEKNTDENKKDYSFWELISNKDE